jgi:hypothetical protein
MCQLYALNPVQFYSNPFKLLAIFKALTVESIFKENRFKAQKLNSSAIQMFTF